MFDIDRLTIDILKQSQRIRSGSRLTNGSLCLQVEISIANKCSAFKSLSLKLQKCPQRLKWLNKRHNTLFYHSLNNLLIRTVVLLRYLVLNLIKVEIIRFVTTATCNLLFTIEKLKVMICVIKVSINIIFALPGHLCNRLRLGLMNECEIIFLL